MDHLINHPVILGVFSIIIIAMLLLDLGVLNKKGHAISNREAAIWSITWISLAMGFSGIIYYFLGAEKFMQFQGAYWIEKALSVDNIFVMVLIFSAFSVEEKYYHRVLFWGIIGALCLRFLFIFTGAVLLAKFSWVMYVFGAFLIYTGAAMFFGRNEDESLDPENHKVVKFAAKYFPVATEYEGGKFIIKQAGKWFITPLFIVLLVVEFTDLLFAVDSIPAIFSVTKDPYIVFFSNIFAILGLRSMFFLLVNIIHKFQYLKIGLSILLVFIGFKMLAHHYLVQVGFNTLHSLVVILLILSASIIASLLFPKKEN